MSRVSRRRRVVRWSLGVLLTAALVVVAAAVFVELGIAADLAGMIAGFVAIIWVAVELYEKAHAADLARLLEAERFDSRHRVEDHLIDPIIEAAYALDRTTGAAAPRRSPSASETDGTEYRT